MKIKLIPGLIAAVLVIAVGAAVVRAVTARNAQQQVAAQPNAAQAVAELAPTDTVRVQLRDVGVGLPVSGSLRAVNSAVIKARVAGELRGLTVREGDFVQAGQIIARIDDSEYQSRVRQASEQAASSKAQVEVAQRQYDNNKALVAQGFISATALDTSTANLNAARATYQASNAAIEITRKAVLDTVLKSPIAGQVSQRLAQPGERVGVETRIVEIVDLRALELEAALSAADSAQVRVGQTAELQAEGQTKAVRARVVRINPSAQTGSRNVLVYLGIDRAPGDTEVLRQGQFVQGTLGTATSSLLSVPVSAVRTDKPAPYVQAIENDQIVHKTVQMGERGLVGGETVVAITGVAAGTAVVAGNIGTLREGTRVTFTSLPATGSSVGAATGALMAAPANAASKPTP